MSYTDSQNERSTTKDGTSSPSIQISSKDDFKNNNKINITSSSSSKQEIVNRLFTNATILAPMVRASTTPLRTLCLSYGADLVYTEEIIDRSILSCDRIENTTLGTIDYVRKPSFMSPKQQKRMKECNTAVILRKAPEEHGKFVYQMGTGNAGHALESALFIEKDFDVLDINMGCPKKFSVVGGMGSALLSGTCDIIKTLSNNLSKPLTAKIRLLPTTHETLHFCQSLVKAGVNAITVHARHRDDDTALIPAKDIEWKYIVEDLGKDIPIILNGDMYTKEDIQKFKDETGASSVMLARGALYNPSIFSSQPNTNRTQVVQQYIQHALRWETNYKNAKYVICEMMNNRRHLQSRTPTLPQHFLKNQTIQDVCACKNIRDISKLWDVDWIDVAGEKVQKRWLEKSTFVETGEHVYKDEYFLKPEEFKSNNNCGDTDLIGNDVKRPRI